MHVRRNLLRTIVLCAAVIASLSVHAAFSLVHQTGAYGELQPNGMQKVHTDYQILYAKPGETVFLYRPERCTFVGYVRWYCYDTDRTVPAWYSAEDSPTDVAIPRIQSTWSKDTLAASLKFKARNEYGWFGYSLMAPAETGKATAGDGNFVEIKYTMHKGNSIYRIACDQGIWNDYSPATWNNNTAMTEPTLSKRTIYEIRPAAWMADSLENYYKVTPEKPNDNYLEEHKMIAPTGRQLYIGPDMMCLGAPNNGTKVALGQYTYYGLTNYYYINSQGNVTAAGDKSKWKWYKNGVYDSSITFYSKGAQFAAVSSPTPGTVTYTLKYNPSEGYYFNVARFTVTYMDVDQVGPSTKVPAPTKKMDKIYEETFNYDRPGTTDFAFWNGYFDVDESTYGYYTKNLSPSNRQTERNKITWSEYAVTNRKSVWVSSGTAPQVYQHVDGKGNEANNAKEGYMLYCDGSQNPGLVFNLKVNADLCAGSTMYFSAWLCDASSNGSGKSAPNMDFVVTGIDAKGNEHALTTFTTGEFGINAVNKVGEEAKMERGKWYQIMFPVKFDAGVTYPSYRLRIRNKSTSSDGNDFAIDDIRIYVQKPPVMPIQASTSDCIDKAVDSVRAYLRIDYRELEDEITNLYYQWREGDNIIHNAYYNIDSINAGLPANTFGCIPILTTDEAIEASGLDTTNLLAFDAAFRDTEVPVYRYIKEQVSPTVQRYVLYVAQPIEVSLNHDYTGFVATHPNSLGTREGCGTYADMIIAGGTRIIIEDHTTLGDSVVSMCGHRTYTLDIVLIQIIQDETDPEDPLKSDTTLCRADWLIGDSTYVRENPGEYNNLTFEQIEQTLQLYRSNPEAPEPKLIIDNLKQEGKFIENASSITMQPTISLSYTAFPRAGSAGSKQVCTSPRFLHIRPSTEIATMMAVGNSSEVLPPRVTNRPRIVRISDAQKRSGSFTLPLYLKGDDTDGEEYNIERIILESSTNPSWTPVELDYDKAHIENVDQITLFGSALTSLDAGYDYTFHIAFEGEDAPHVGCERGRTYFTLRIVPDVVTWYGGNWNVDFNWDPFIPLPETDVILLPQNYNVTFSDDSIYDFNYVRNQCHDIYLPAGMSMAGQENLRIHGQVYIDIPAKTWEWSLTSVPLQGIVTGDLFVSHNESTNPFEVAPIDHTGDVALDRHTFEIYHSPYDAVHDKWHVPTNTLTRELYPTEAYMIGVDAAPGAPDTAIIRLPKPSNMYHYYDFNTHNWREENEDIVRTPNYGKPAWNGESTIALREVYGNVYLLGNPTFGHINITKLVADNADKLTGAYYMPNALVDEPSLSEMTTFTHDVATESEDVLLPPCRGILLEGKGDPSNELVISISPKDITEPGFAPIKKMTKHAGSSFHPEGGVPIGAIKSSAESPVVINETSLTIDEELDPYHDGIIATLHLNRELYRDGAFNTLCLPFGLSAAEIAAGPLTGAQLYEFARAEKIGEAQLDIYVIKASAIQAGVPYLVKWAPTEPEVIPMPLVFHNVHIKDIQGQTIGEENEIQFVGSVPRKLMVYEDKNNLFVGANNILYWPNTHNPLRGFRAYFQVPATGLEAVPKGTPARIVIQENIATDSEETQGSRVHCTKILRDGQIYIIRDRSHYTLLGVPVEP